MELKRATRDPDGLIAGVQYVINEHGQIDWRKMIKPEYLVVNNAAFEKRGEQIPTSIEGVDDKDLLILLNGIKELAKLRGYISSVPTHIVTPSAEMVSVGWSITWIPNFETESRVVTSSGAADAWPGNTSGFSRLYLTAIAENRAFIRCVRNFLGIYIVGKDEIAPDAPVEDNNANVQINSPTALLLKLMQEKNVTFEVVKQKLIEENFANASDLVKLEDIPRTTVFELIDRLKKKK